MCIRDSIIIDYIQHKVFPSADIVYWPQRIAPTNPGIAQERLSVHVNIFQVQIISSFNVHVKRYFIGGKEKNIPQSERHMV